MIKKILVATDASKYSKNAFETAVGYARQFQAEIELIHVFIPYGYHEDFLGLPNLNVSDEQIKEIGENVFKETLEGIDTSGVKINKKIIEGHPAASILEEVNNGIDLIIMGSRGHGPISGALLGSVTQRVLANASCPVLVVK